MIYHLQVASAISVGWENGWLVLLKVFNFCCNIFCISRGNPWSRQWVQVLRCTGWKECCRSGLSLLDKWNVGQHLDFLNHFVWPSLNYYLFKETYLVFIYTLSSLRSMESTQCHALEWLPFSLIVFPSNTLWLAISKWKHLVLFHKISFTKCYVPLIHMLRPNHANVKLVSRAIVIRVSVGQSGDIGKVFTVIIALFT